MSKYDRDSADVYAVKRLGDEIGYGHLMALAHELWARHLEEKGLPREGAFCAVGHSMVKEEYVEDAVTDPIYKVVVERALADTPQTEEICERCIYVRGSQWCQGCNGTPKRWNGEKVVDTPQTETKAKTQNSNLTFEEQTDEEYINNLPWTEKDCPWK